MSHKVKSTGSKLSFRGWNAVPKELDHKRIKYSRIKGPKGVQIDDEMLNAALKKAKGRNENIHRLRQNDAGDVILTPRSSHCASRAVKQLERLEYEAFRLIVNALIELIREAKDKLKRAASTRKHEKAPSFFNDKSRTIPVPYPAS